MPSDSVAFIPAGAHERVVASALRLAIRIGFAPALMLKTPVAWQRFWVKQATRLTRTAVGVHVEAKIVGGVKGEWLRPSVASTKGTILYLHGGGYCVGAPKQHRAITSHAGMEVFAPVYRLAPEHPFPAALEDAISVYQALADAGPVVIAGDSAGAGLALATALTQQERSLPAPAALVLFSPWVDLTLSKVERLKPDIVLSTAWLEACAQHYLAGKDASLPLASPIFADLHGLPPVFIQTGTDDLLHGDALRLHKALVGARVEAHCEIVPDRWHVFQLHAGVLPSATMAVTRAGAFALQNIASKF